MSTLRLTASLACILAFAATAVAQVSPPPPAAQTPPAENSAAKKATPHALPKKHVTPAADPKSPAASPPATPTPAAAAPSPTADDPSADLVYGAYQRGQYKTALDLARSRAQ